MSLLILDMEFFLLYIKKCTKVALEFFKYLNFHNPVEKIPNEQYFYPYGCFSGLFIYNSNTNINGHFALLQNGQN